MGYFFARLVVDLGAEIFLISCIEKLTIYISLVQEAFYIKKLKSAAPIIKISIVGNLANYFCKQTGTENKIQSLGLKNSWLIVIILSLVLIQ